MANASDNTLNVALVSFFQAFAEVGIKLKQQERALEAPGAKKPQAQASAGREQPRAPQRPAPATATGDARTEELERELATLKSRQANMEKLLTQQTQLLSMLVNQRAETPLKVVNDG